MGRKGEEFGACRVTHPGDAGQNGGDKEARDVGHGKGTKHTEVVRLECSVQRAEKCWVLFPSSTNKLLAQWQGPYGVLEQVGSVDYMIDMHDHRKRRKIFLVNMRSYFLHPQTSCSLSGKGRMEFLNRWAVWTI